MAIARVIGTIAAVSSASGGRRGLLDATTLRRRSWAAARRALRPELYECQHASLIPPLIPKRDPRDHRRDLGLTREEPNRDDLS
jgi:hypothetical protein